MKKPRHGLIQKDRRWPTLYCLLVLATLTTFPLVWSFEASAAAFDAAMFAQPLPDGNGLIWDDPREIHKVMVQFAGPAPAADKVHLEYWGSHWPEQHLPKDRAPGGGDIGWMELGNWYRGGWRVADTEAMTDNSRITFTFRPVNEKEFPKSKGYD